jgi:hypothetical protein
MVLSALERFNGEAVGGAGAIAFRFASLQLRTGELPSLSERPPAWLEEQPWAFTSANADQLTAAKALGCINLVLQTWLWYLLRAYPALLEKYAVLGIVRALSPLMLSFACLFALVPALRYAMITYAINPPIARRNLRRKKWLEFLLAEQVALAPKIILADSVAAIRSVGEADALYTTQSSSALAEAQMYILSRQQTGACEPLRFHG